MSNKIFLICTRRNSAMDSHRGKLRHHKKLQTHLM